MMIPINVTLVGIVTDVNDSQNEKAEEPNDSGYINESIISNMNDGHKR